MSLGKLESKKVQWMRLERSLTGLSVGDAFGERFFWDQVLAAKRMETRELPAEVPWRYTDDTEMALAIADVIEANGEILGDALAQAFVRRFSREAWRGYGGGAMDLLEEIRRGTGWREAAKALFGGGSYGNGGAMRAAPLGAYFASDGMEKVVEQAIRSAEVTHAHLEGQAGAIAVAVAAAQAVRMGEHFEAAEGRKLMEVAHTHTPEGKTRKNIEDALNLSPAVQVAHAAKMLGSGQQVSAQDTVGFSLWCAARCWGDFEGAMWCTVSGWGDRDTTCAIVGGILGAGGAQIPEEWIARREALARHI